jgi:phage baseplate assembly protein W
MRNIVVETRGTIGTSSGYDNIRDSIMMITSTRKGTRAGFPDYGCDVVGRIFDHMDEFTETIIKQDLVDAIAKYEKRVKVVSVQLVTDYDKLTYAPKITYEVIEDTKSVTVTKIR